MRAFWGLFLVLAGVCTVGCKSEDSSAPKPAALPPAPAAPEAPPAARPPEPVAEESEPDEPKPEEMVSGNIVLPKARKKDVKKGDIMFLIVRRAGGAPGPGAMLAVQKLMVEEFPMPFALSGRDAMIPGTKFEGELNLSVRVDKDGDPMTRRKGDVFGELLGVKVGSQNLSLQLDTVQKEDQMLGAGAPGGPVHGASPHGGGAPAGAAPPTGAHHGAEPGHAKPAEHP